jgi:hypothetical protein
MLMFIDFKKTFDKVYADLLMLKLFHYGFDNTAISLTKSFFSNRRQLTVIGNNKSNFNDLLLGVPQGSVPGPLLILIFINVLPHCLPNMINKLFAGDTTLIKSAKKYEALINSFKCDITSLFDWYSNNRIDINYSKMYYMFIHDTRQVLPQSIDCGNGVVIEVV